MKVTRLPGRDPAKQRRKQSPFKTSHRLAEETQVRLNRYRAAAGA
jgi:hypothetical protein